MGAAHLFITQLTTVFLLIVLQTRHVFLCIVETGDSTIFLDIPESVANLSSQVTRPRVLPIKGNSSEISLKIISDSENIFRLRDKQLELQRPLDRDIKDTSIILLQIRCTNLSTNVQRTIPVTIRVMDINDNPPQFLFLPYKINISEMAPVGSLVFNNLHSSDKDTSVNSLVEYYVAPGDGSKFDGYGTFGIDSPLDGEVILKRNLDYDKVNRYETTIIAVDRASESKQRLTSTVTLTITVLDANSTTKHDDSCTISEGTCKYHQTTNTNNETEDTANSTYTLEFGNRNAKLNFYSNLEKQAETITSVMELTTDRTPQQQRLTDSKPNLSNLQPNRSLPLLVATSSTGFVDEESPVGTTVMTNLRPNVGLRLSVIDIQSNLEEEDQVNSSDQDYLFELSTRKFSVNNEGYLVVADPHLDRDQRESVDKITFQAVVHKLSENLSSLPITLVIKIDNINDNSPHFDNIEPITIASTDALIFITQVKAHDADVDDEISYSIGQVSSGASGKFSINNITGVVKSSDILDDGKTYMLTILATDKGGRIGSQILEVHVESPIGRVAPTVPSRHIFDVQVSEAVAVGSAILSLQPGPSIITDTTYSIMEGNEDERFSLSPISGVLTIRQPLDRETVSNYVLGLRGVDKFGLTINTIVNIEVTDINDSNPEFVGEPFVFYVNENTVNVVIGRVKAIDADAWINGMIYYAASADAPISVDELTGEVRTVRAFDYERQNVEYVIISAKDGAQQPRIATATITIMVIDVPDEIPIFRKNVYDGAVPENMPNADVIQVTAHDADAFKQITYVIRKGPLNKFTVNPTTGVVRTIWPLDYEESSSYLLIIGTRENQFDHPGSSCIVRVNVLDRNDIPPHFTNVPPAIKIKDDLQSGTIITKLTAVDGDGTPPNNVIKYYLSNPERGNQYFEIDQDSGIVTLKRDLKLEPSTKLKLETGVYDLGFPQLSSTINISITIDHTRPSEKLIAFLDTIVKADIEENALGNTIVKTIPIINKPSTGAGLDFINCEIKSGNELDHFYVKRSANSDCELRTKGQKLDYESRHQYQIVITLRSNTVNIDSLRATTQVVVNVQDMNDNRPVFAYNKPMHQLIGQRYLVAVNRELAAWSPFTKITATDQDSGAFGDVVYEIVRYSSSEESYFTIDSDTGLISNTKTFDLLNRNISTFHIEIIARDNPLSKTDFLNSTTKLTVNLISDEHRLVLVILDAIPEKVNKQKEKLIKMLQLNTKYVVNVEKIESRKYLNNSKLTSDFGGTDVWLNVIDPDTLAIVRLEDNQLHTFLLDEHQQKNLLYSMSSVLEMKVESIRTPVLYEILTSTQVPTLIRAEYEMDGFQAALIALAGIVAVFGFVGIIYICVIWTRYVSYRDHLRRLSLAPKYEPVLFEPTFKPYETQVLRMNVNSDDTSSAEEGYSNFEFNRPREDLTYMRKEIGDVSTLEIGHSSSTDSDSLEIADHALFSPSIRSRGRHERVTFADVMQPAQNPVYHSSDENTGSPTEEIVRFPTRRSTTPMITTEL